MTDTFRKITTWIGIFIAAAALTVQPVYCAEPADGSSVSGEETAVVSPDAQNSAAQTWEESAVGTSCPDATEPLTGEEDLSGGSSGSGADGAAAADGQTDPAEEAGTALTAEPDEEASERTERQEEELSPDIPAADRNEDPSPDETPAGVSEEQQEDPAPDETPADLAEEQQEGPTPGETPAGVPEEQQEGPAPGETPAGVSEEQQEDPAPGETPADPAEKQQEGPAPGKTSAGVSEKQQESPAPGETPAGLAEAKNKAFSPADSPLTKETGKEETEKKETEKTDRKGSEEERLSSEEESAETVRADASAAAKVSLKKARITGPSSVTYTGAAQKPKPTVTLSAAGGTRTLKEGRDYILSYENNVNAGTAGVTVTGIGNYTGSVTKSFTVKPAPLSSVRLKYHSLPYTGKLRTQTGSVVVKAKVNGKEVVLTLGTDYKVQYENAVNAGTATAIITAKGNYTGTVRRTYTITPVPLSSVTIKYPELQHTGKVRTQNGTTVVKAKVNGKPVVLSPGTDYRIRYKNAVNIGTATMTVTGRGNYTGSIRKTFRITADWEDKITSSGSLFSDNYEKLRNNTPINPTDPAQTTFSQFASLITGSSVIPGLLQTHIIRTDGSHTVCGDMVTQGMCLADGYLLIAAYCYQEEHSSVLYVLKDGTYLETVVLTRADGTPFVNHVGGLTYLNGTVYLAGEPDHYVYSIPLQEILDPIGRQDAVRIPVRTAFRTERTVSFLTPFENTIYAGTWYWNENNYPAGNSTMRPYDPATGQMAGAEVVLPSNIVQGASFVRSGGTTFLLLSKSYGRGNTSTLLSAVMDGYGRVTEYRALSAPNMTENLFLSGDSLYVNFESAAKEYRTNGDQSRIRPLDRVISLDYRSLIA